jgi:hypothetical protein
MDRGRIWVLLSTANIFTFASALRSNMVSPMVGARIPPELHHQLLEVASRLQVTPSEIVVAALRQYLERLQTAVSASGAEALNSPTVAGILGRLEQLERRVEVLEAARSEQRPATLPTDLEALPVLELRRLARRVIGPGGDRDPSTGKHLRRAELLAALRRVLDEGMGEIPHDYADAVTKGDEE